MGLSEDAESVSAPKPPLPHALMVARLLVINEVSAVALKSPVADAVYRAVAESIVRHLPYLEASVFAIDAEAGQAVLVAQSPPHEPLGYTQPLDVGLIGVAASECRSVLANDTATDPRYVRPPGDQEPCASELCIPVLEQGRVVAIIDVECRDAGAFGDSDRLALESIANVVGLALHAAEVHAELTRQVEQVREAQCQLIQSERLADVGRLTALVAHEIRNPLTTIGGFARRLLKRADDEQEQHYASIIVDETERLGRLLAGIMDFVRPGEPRKQRTDIAAVLDRAIALTSAARATKHIAIDRDIEDGLPTLWADPGQLEQVLINVLTNACDAIDDEGTITTTIGCDGDHLVLRIADTGCGIGPDQLHSLFDPFYTTKPGGNGLGLPIAGKIIEDHGGRIDIGSEPGRGTHVTVRLPIGEPPAQSAS